MKWLNLLGLCLQFLSFWLVAPEFIGEDGLTKFEDLISRMIGGIPNAVITSLGFFFGFYFSHILFNAGTFNTFSLLEKGFLGIVIIAFFITLFFQKKLKAWLITNVANPTILKLREEDTRKNILLLGAGCFTVGFLLQVIAVLMS